MKIIKSINIIFFLLIFSGCGYIPQGDFGHSTNTQVVLSKANYRTINSVQGQATARFVLGYGPSMGRLYSRAKKELLHKANLAGGGEKSRALINMTTDEQIRYFVWPWPLAIIYFSKTVYVTADVIEFKES